MEQQAQQCEVLPSCCLVTVKRTEAPQILTPMGRWELALQPEVGLILPWWSTGCGIPTDTPGKELTARVKGARKLLPESAPGRMETLAPCGNYWVDNKDPPPSCAGPRKNCRCLRLVHSYPYYSQPNCASCPQSGTSLAKQVLSSGPLRLG